MPDGDLVDLNHPGGPTRQVDRDDGTGVGGDRRLDPGWVDVQIGPDIDEHRLRPGQCDRGRGGDERVRDGDNLVARAGPAPRKTRCNAKVPLAIPSPSSAPQ